MKRVSLAEQLFITPAFILVLCWQYWLWSRTDWKPEYAHTKWQLVPLFLLVLLVWRKLSYQKEQVDELASANMKRCDAICYKVVFCLLLAACACLCRGHTIPCRAAKCSKYGLDDTGGAIYHEHFKNCLIRSFR